MEKPLINKKYLLEKFPGKGGWTYAIIPEVLQDHRAKFGWVKVKGTIDSFELKNYRLMPMGNGMLFLPVKADIRKKIGKEAGDWVKVVLYADNDEVEIPEEFLLCLEEEPLAHRFFLSLTDSEKKMYIDWFISAKKDETKIDRMAKAINKLLLKKKFMDK